MLDEEAKLGYEDEKSDEEILAEAKAFYLSDVAFEANTVNDMEFDIGFEQGFDHWDKGVAMEREGEGRPVLKVPRMNQFLNKVKNENRQSKPNIKIAPRGAESEADQKKRIKYAKNRQGLVRFIQYDSKATEAYQNAFDDAVTCGRGFYRLSTEYESPMSFNQSIKIERVKNTLSVIMDKARKELDYSDCRHGFIVEKIPRETFKAENPEADPIDWDTSAQGNTWIDEDVIWVLEYYCIRYRKKTLLLLDNGKSVYKEDLKDFDKEEKQAILDTVEKEREVKAPYVMWYKLTAKEVLEKQEIAGTYIPIFPVIGLEKEIGGKLLIKGMIRDITDVQKMYDYWSSTETELLTLSPKAPFIGAKGQFKGFEKQWGSANKVNHAYLQYNPVTTNGVMAPPPQRQPFAGPPVGILQAKQGLIDDMRAITGIHEAGLGQSTNETSGRAILAREAQGDTANYHYTYNLGISLNHCGRVINQWLPIYYDTDRIEKILGDDGKESTIELGKKDDDGDVIGLGDGEFDVVVTMGPAFHTQRQESAEAIFEFMRVAPNAVPLISDLLVSQMDWPGADVIAERLRKTVPPEILEQEGGENKMAKQLQEAMGQLQQSQGLIEQMTQQIEILTAENESNKAEIQKDLVIQDSKSDTAIEVARIKAGSSELIERNKSITDFYKSAQPLPQRE